MILSYNLCFGCMLSNSDSKYDITTQKLSGYCKDLKKANKKNICLENVSKGIDNFVDEDYNFVSLQEASNWKKVIKNSDKLKRMSYVHHYIEHPYGKPEHVTLYNHNKYKLFAVKIGNIGLGSRPYHILFLKGIDNQYYIYINLHNEHNISKKFLSQCLSKNIDKVIKIRKNNNENMNLRKETNILHDKMKNNIINVIVSGDFNDAYGANFWKGFKPFKYTNIQSIKDIVVNSNNIKPPQSCCVGETSLRKNKKDDKWIGDYILINKTLSFVKNNHIPENFNFDAKKNPTSDHLPVLCKIK